MTTQDGERDYALVGALVEHASETEYASVQAFADALLVSRSTMYRLFRGDPRIKARTLRRAEKLLGMPAGVLDSIADHDFEAAHAAGLPPSTLAWLKQKAAAATPDQPVVKVTAKKDQDGTTRVSARGVKPRTPSKR